jgi:hypothetical protein
MSKQCSEAVLRIRTYGQRCHGLSTKTSRTFGKDITDTRHRYHGHPTKMSRTHGADITDTRRRCHGRTVQISQAPDEDVTDARCRYHGHTTRDVTDARQTDNTDVILTLLSFP